MLFHARLVRWNGTAASGAERVAPGDRFEFPDPNAPGGENPIAKARAPRLTTPHGRHLARLYEDEAVLVISKPAEVPVHRGQGGFTRRDTLEDVLERAYPPPPNATRAQQGYYFVHRLDMETSGCLLIAKTEHARDELVKAFSERRMHKEYLAVVAGEAPWTKLAVKKPISYIRADESGATFSAARKRARGKPVLRGQKKGIPLEEGDESGKACETHFEVVARYKGYTLLRAIPRTGRTHQIRVHLQSTGHALAYDPLYGRATPLRLREFSLRASASEEGEQVVLNRLPLHAWKLRFAHPETGATIAVEAPLPRDLKEFVRLLRKYRARGTAS
ncbi:MAG: RluA family pseudouridine synthase [Planctomycetota bacterium]|nr:RluA family pseudouridine synthase [Planctomycetota bacterium]